MNNTMLPSDDFEFRQEKLNEEVSRKLGVPQLTH